MSTYLEGQRVNANNQAIDNNSNDHVHSNHYIPDNYETVKIYGWNIYTDVMA